MVRSIARGPRAARLQRHAAMRRLETACPQAAFRVYETAFNNISNDLTSYESIEPQLSYLSAIALWINRCFSPTRADLEAAPKGAVGKIRHGAHVHFPAGNVAANDLAVWRLRQLSGKRRCQWPEYHWRRSKRM